LLQLPLAVVAVLLFGFAGLGGDVGLWSLAVSWHAQSFDA
jgi:hypothetical protein